MNIHPNARNTSKIREELQAYLMLYNQHILQKNIMHISPMTKLREWQTNHPDLLIRRLDNQSSPDTDKSVISRLQKKESLVYSE